MGPARIIGLPPPAEGAGTGAIGAGEGSSRTGGASATSGASEAASAGVALVDDAVSGFGGSLASSDGAGSAGALTADLLAEGASTAGGEGADRLQALSVTAAAKHANDVDANAARIRSLSSRCL